MLCFSEEKVVSGSNEHNNIIAGNLQTLRADGPARHTPVGSLVKVAEGARLDSLTGGVQRVGNPLWSLVLVYSLHKIDRQFRLQHKFYILPGKYR